MKKDKELLDFVADGIIVDYFDPCFSWLSNEVINESHKFISNNINYNIDHSEQELIEKAKKELQEAINYIE